MDGKSLKRWYTARAPFLLIALAAMAAGVNLWHGLYVDEYAAWGRTRLPWHELVENRLKAGHMPTYFAMLKVWVGWFGDSEVVLRLPSAAAFVCSVLLMRALGRRLWGRWSGNLAAGVLCFHQLAVWSAQTARPYAFVLMFNVLAALCIVQWWSSGHKRWLPGVSLAIAAGFLFQPLSAMAAAAFVVALLPAVARARAKCLPVILVILGTLAVLALPGLLIVHKEQEYEVRRGSVSVLRGLATVIGYGYGDFHLWAGAWSKLSSGKWFKYVVCVLVLILAFGVLRASRRRIPRLRGGLSDFPRTAFVLCWVFVPAILLVAASGFMSKSVLNHHRYGVAALGGFALLTAAGMGNFRRTPGGWTARLLGACLAVAMLPSTLAWWMEPGDGPKVLVRLMERYHPVKCAVGYTNVLQYELRENAPERMVMCARQPAEKVRELIGTFREPVWLVVYNNKPDGLDEVMAEPPAHFVATKRVAFRDARAVLLVPASLLVTP